MLSKTIDKEMPIPLYIQLSQLIETEITVGNVPDGSALPSERELCDAYDVSRATVREAINVLKQKELVVTRRGSGNYVRALKSLDRDLLGVHDFDLQIEASGHTNQVDVLHFDPQMQSKRIASVLKIHETDAIVNAVRLRKADEMPLFIERIYLPAALFPGLKAEDFSSTNLFSKKIRHDYGIEIDEVTLVLEPILLGKSEAEVLQVSELPAAGLLNERISSDKGGTPVVFSQWIFSSRRCRHLLKIKAK